MMTRYEYAAFERWTAQVRYQTQRDMQRLRAQRARAERQALSEPPLARLQRWWQAAQRTLQGGVPALERAFVQLVAPRTRPEQLLPDPTAQR